VQEDAVENQDGDAGQRDRRELAADGPAQFPTPGDEGAQQDVVEGGVVERVSVVPLR
jgi:hypothetical protein